ncbi:MAG: Cthe_2314 family HEPN domain-containing protein [Candidatus Latescibacteria bacterium]|nr:Cthe_2314 family HEPN domain-containing protein [Candidatus Latescibacterota bacterium]
MLGSIEFKYSHIDFCSNLLSQIDFRTYQQFKFTPRNTELSGRVFKLNISDVEEFKYPFMVLLDNYFGAIATTLDIIAHFLITAYNITPTGRVYFGNRLWNDNLSQKCPLTDQIGTIINTYETSFTVVKNVRNTITHAAMLVTSSQEQIGIVNESLYGGEEERIDWIFDDFFFRNSSGYLDPKYENTESKELHRL